MKGKGDVWFTKSKDGRSLFAINLPKDGASFTTVTWQGNVPAKGQKIRLLANGKTLRYTVKDGRVEVRLPFDVDGPLALEIR